MPTTDSGQQHIARRRSRDELAPLANCPNCQNGELTVVETDDGAVFRCETCDRHWRYELGYVWPCGSR